MYKRESLRRITARGNIRDAGRRGSANTNERGVVKRVNWVLGIDGGIKSWSLRVGDEL